MSIITQKTMDPREVVKTDEYDLISDDEEDFLKGLYHSILYLFFYNILTHES